MGVQVNENGTIKDITLKFTGSLPFEGIEFLADINWSTSEPGHKFYNIVLSRPFKNYAWMILIPVISTGTHTPMFANGTTIKLENMFTMWPVMKMLGNYTGSGADADLDCKLSGTGMIFNSYCTIYANKEDSEIRRVEFGQASTLYTFYSKLYGIY